MQIAGAAAERGQSLAEVTALAQKVADNIGEKFLCIKQFIEHINY